MKIKHQNNHDNNNNKHTVQIPMESFQRRNCTKTVILIFFTRIGRSSHGGFGWKTLYIFLGPGGWQLIDNAVRQYCHFFPAYRQDSHWEVLDPHIAAKPTGSITNTCQLAGLKLGLEGAGSAQEKKELGRSCTSGTRRRCGAHTWWRSPLASSRPMSGRDPLAKGLAGVLSGQW